jgi:hypothetical protein
LQAETNIRGVARCPVRAFTQDRIDLLVWRMQDKGLTRRKS